MLGTPRGNNRLLQAIIADDRDAVLRSVRFEGAHPDANCGDGMQTPMVCVASCLRKLNALRSLMELGADVNAADRSGTTALLAAVRTRPTDNDAVFYGILRDAGADFLKADAFGDTVLSIAAKYGQQELVDVLIQHGARVTDKGTHVLLGRLSKASQASKAL